MILIPHESIELQDGEDLHAACDRVKSTQKRAAGGRYTSVTMSVDKQQRKLISAYAPAQSSARPDFLRTLAARITRRTILGIDANCVPDTAADLKRDANTPYDNKGADILRDAVDEKGLVDVVREVLGNEPYFSAHHVVAGGACWSRIDQIYAPHTDSTQYTVGGPKDIFPRESAVEIDHTMVDIRSKTVKPKRGTDLPRISEAICDDPSFVAELHHTIVHAHAHVHPGELRKGWEALKVELQRMCMERSKKEKYNASQNIKRKRKILANIDILIQKGTAAPQQIAARTRLKKELSQASKAEYTLHQTLEKEAYNMGKAHDRCTREFFAP